MSGILDYSGTSLLDFFIFLKDGTNGLMFDLLLLPIFFIILIASRDYDAFNSFIIACFINAIIGMILFFIGLISGVSIGIWLGLLVFGLLGKFLIK
jgi:hypothetical protein